MSSSTDKGKLNLRVLHVIARMNVGGTATYLVNLLDGLRERGVECLLAFGRVPENESEDQRAVLLRSLRIPELSRRISPIDDLVAFRKLGTTIRDFKPDVVHSHTFKAGLLVRARTKHQPTVHTFHGHHLSSPEFKGVSLGVLTRVESRLAKSTDVLIAVGNKVMEDLVAARIAPPEKFVSIPPGVTPLESAGVGPTRADLGIPENAIVVGWLGRLTFVKRPDRVVALAEGHRDLTFIVAGDGELMSQLRSCAPPNVRLVGVQDPGVIWSICDIALITSDSEGMPLSAIEAQVAGVPVIATDVGSVCEVVENGVTGLVVKSNLGALSAALDELKRDTNRRFGMAYSARVRALAVFSRDRMIDRHLEAYFRALGTLD